MDLPAAIDFTGQEICFNDASLCFLDRLRACDYTAVLIFFYYQLRNFFVVRSQIHFLPIFVSGITKLLQQPLGWRIFECLLFFLGHHGPPAPPSIKQGLVDLPVTVGIMVDIGLNGRRSGNLRGIPLALDLMEIKHRGIILLVEESADIAEGAFRILDEVLVFHHMEVGVLPVGLRSQVVVNPSLQAVLNGKVPLAMFQGTNHITAIAQDQQDSALWPEGQKSMNLENVGRCLFDPCSFACA
jgi:hypothetical protein